MIELRYLNTKVTVHVSPPGIYGCETRPEERVLTKLQYRTKPVLIAYGTSDDWTDWVDVPTVGASNGES